MKALFKARTKAERKRKTSNATFEDTNYEILEEKSGKKKLKEETSVRPPEHTESLKSMEKREVRTCKRGRRAELYKRLEMFKLTDDDLCHFLPSSFIGACLPSNAPKIKKKKRDLPKSDSVNIKVADGHVIKCFSSSEDEVSPDDGGISIRDVDVAGFHGVDHTPNTIKKILRHRKPLSQTITLSLQPSKYVLVHRSEEVMKSRNELPIITHEQDIMEAITEHDIVIISGETGCGKTTQLPQFLYEAGYTVPVKGSVFKKMTIGVTEPRRVAAIAMCERVAYELGFESGECGYKIRYMDEVNEETVIKFMTDGILIHEIEKDFLLSKYSVIIIDEAHERSLFSDLLIGLLTRIVPQRRKKLQPLKVVIMSATLNLDALMSNKRLFPAKPPPMITVPARQYPVEIHFSKSTNYDYIQEAYEKVKWIHKNFPPSGSILVFVTGRNEVKYLCGLLSSKFSSKKTKEVTLGDAVKKSIDFSIDNYSVETELSGTSDKSQTIPPSDVSLKQKVLGMNVLPLYASLSSTKQKRVFNQPKDGVRTCIVSTNIAETSITIPFVKFVVDTGKVKERLYDGLTGACKFVVGWCSKASSEQRAGRAGRVEAGHCYRLYSSAVYQHELPEFSTPDILRRPTDETVLQMKCLGIYNILNFPFITPPTDVAVEKSEAYLLSIKAVKKYYLKNEEVVVPTALGKEMIKFPIPPRFSILIIKSLKKSSCNYLLTRYMSILVCALFVRDLFLNSAEKVDSVLMKRTNWVNKAESIFGDFAYLISVICSCLHSKNKEETCASCGIRYEALTEVMRLNGQLFSIIHTHIGVQLSLSDELPVPTEPNLKKLSQLTLYAFPDQIARRLPVEKKNGKSYHPYQCMSTDEEVYIRPSSVLHSNPPKYVMYYYLQHSKRLYMNEVCPVDASDLYKFPHFCIYDKDHEGNVFYNKNSLYYTCSTYYGTRRWQLPLKVVKFKNTESCYYNYFLKLFLEGEIVTSLKPFKELMYVNSESLISKGGVANRNLKELLLLFIDKDLRSPSKIFNYIAGNKKNFMEKYLVLFPESVHQEILHALS